MPTQKITFTEWLPDQPGLANALMEAKNVVAQQIGYGPMKEAMSISDQTSDLTLSALYAAKEPSGDTILFAAGDNKVYTVSGVGNLTDLWYFTGTYSQSGTTITVTSNDHKLKNGQSIYLNFTSGTATDDDFFVTYIDADTFSVTASVSATTSGNVNIQVTADGYSAQSRVRFTQFGKNIIFTNNEQPLQSYILGESDAFRNLSDDAPIAKYITVVRDFVVVANVKDGSEQLQYRVQWSDLNDETTWTYADYKQTDFQDLPDGGQIVGIRGGEFGLVLLERAIYRMSYVGTPFIFQFDNISRGKGCISAGSIAQYQGVTFFLSDDGFYMCDGQTVTPIGAEKVDRWFFGLVDESNLSNMSAAVDPITKTIIWNFTTNNGTYAQLIYSFKVAKWTYADMQVDYVSDASSSAVTLEELDDISTSIDLLPLSLDSINYIGGRFFLGATKSGMVYSFTGVNTTGELVTGDLDLGGNSLVTLARPHIDGGSADVAVASRRLLSDAITYTNDVSADSENRVSLRSAGRYHRIRVRPTGDDWKHAVSVDIDVTGQGVR